MIIQIPYSQFFDIIEEQEFDLAEVFNFSIKRRNSRTDFVPSNHFEFMQNKDVWIFEFDQGIIEEMVLEFGDNLLIVAQDELFEFFEETTPIIPI